MFSLVTYNIWHGLAGQGLVRFREFETASRRRLRKSSLIRELQSSIEPLEPRESRSNSEDLQSADVVVCLQEVNPLIEVGGHVFQSLGLQGEFTLDQAGVRILRKGLPLNLETGLAIGYRGLTAVSKTESSRDMDSGFENLDLQLSGPDVPFSTGLSLQLEEIRMAQVRVFESSQLGRLGLIHAHLHHGFGEFPELIEILETAVQRKTLSREEADQLRTQLKASDQRREREFDRIQAVIERLERSVDLIFVCGDFNTTPESRERARLLDLGFKDLGEHLGPTWDPIRNFENHRIQDGFQYPLPDFGRPEVRALYREFDLKPRRIDFVFLKSVSERTRFQVRSRLLGVSRASHVDLTDEISPSDHFGICVELHPESEPLA